MAMNTVSPVVTEEEMRGFWQRISSMIVSHSVQAQQLQDLQAELQRTNEKVAQVSADSEKVSRELAETWRLVEGLEKERDAAKAVTASVQDEFDRSRIVWEGVNRDHDAQLSQAHDALAQRDQRIAELEERLRSANSQVEGMQKMVTQVEAERDDAKSRSDYYQRRAETAENEVRSAQTHANNAEHERNLAQEKLSEVEQTLEKLRSLFNPAPAPQQPPPIQAVGGGRDW